MLYNPVLKTSVRIFQYMISVDCLTLIESWSQLFRYFWQIEVLSDNWWLD